MIGQGMQVAKLGIMFPVYCTVYMLSPTSPMGEFMKKPFVKFICHSSSYALFLSKSSHKCENMVLRYELNQRHLIATKSIDPFKYCLTYAACWKEQFINIFQNEV
nr:unnamed protein product [Callosobruchus analis]